MIKRSRIYTGIVLGLFLVVFGYTRLEMWKLRRKALKEFAPFMADQEDQKNALLALGHVDLSPSDLNFAGMEQKLGKPARKESGDFNSTRLGWACGKEHCAIWGSFLVPLGQNITPDAVPAGLIINGPLSGNYSNITAREIRLGDSDEKLVELSKREQYDAHKLYHRASWDKNWELAWGGIDGKVLMLVFVNETVQHSLANRDRPISPKSEQ